MTEMATDVQNETNVEASSDVAQQEGGQQGGFAIPEDYKESVWAQGIDSDEGLWKKLAGSQKLIGDRGAFIPQEGASAEEIEAFIGRLDPIDEHLKGKYAPKAPESYEFSDLGDGVTIDDAVTEKFGEISRKYSLTNDAADGIRKDWIGFEQELKIKRSELMNAQFDEMATEMWGDSKDDMIARASVEMERDIPEKMRHLLEDIPNSALLVIAHKMASSGEKPDGMPNTSGSKGLTKEQAREKYTELRKAAQQDPRKQKDFEEFNEMNRHLIAR